MVLWTFNPETEKFNKVAAQLFALSGDDSSDEDSDAFPKRPSPFPSPSINVPTTISILIPETVTDPNSTPNNIAASDPAVDHTTVSSDHSFSSPGYRACYFYL